MHVYFYLFFLLSSSSFIIFLHYRSEFPEFCLEQQTSVRFRIKGFFNFKNVLRSFTPSNKSNYAVSLHLEAAYVETCAREDYYKMRLRQVNRGLTFAIVTAPFWKRQNFQKVDNFNRSWRLCLLAEPIIYSHLFFFLTHRMTCTF